MAEYTIRPKGAARSTEVDLDDGSIGGIYNLDLVETDWGKATQAEPEEEVHSQGATLYTPLEEVWQRRAIRLAGWVECSSLYDKQYRVSRMRQLLQGSLTLRRQGWEIDVFGTGFLEREGSKRSPLLLEYEVVLLATPPFWRLASDLASLAYDALMFPDFGVPVGEAQPPYLFGRDLAGAQQIPATYAPGVDCFTLTNFGTAFAYASATITGAPTNYDLYLRGEGRFRVKVRTDGAGSATLTEASRFYLAPGDNGIRLESSAGGSLNLTPYATMRINFGATRFRYL